MRRPAYWSAVSKMHADLFRADYWRALQNRIREGQWKMFYAYRRRQRFSVRYGEMLF
ncbi:isocitrate dehydrogenase kinase/phosphatase-domain containing protein [Shigella flexneri]